MDIHRVLLSAQGYFELGMLDEAHEELDQLEAKTLERPEFLECRLFLLMQGSRWDEAVTLSRRLREIAPEEGSGYIQGAYCLHELGQTEDARLLLLGAPDQARQEPLYFYNLACYEAVLGNLESARNLLKHSFQLEEALRETARDDQDLEPLREWLATEG